MTFAVLNGNADMAPADKVILDADLAFLSAPDLEWHFEGVILVADIISSDRHNDGSQLRIIVFRGGVHGWSGIHNN